MLTFWCAIENVHGTSRSNLKGELLNFPNTRVVNWTTIRQFNVNKYGIVHSAQFVGLKNFDCGDLDKTV